MTGSLLQPARGFLRRLGQALSLAFWRRPRSRLELNEFGFFIAACGLALLAFAIQDYYISELPVEFFGDGFHAHASYFLLLLIAAWLAARSLRRPALWLTLATLAVLIGIPWTAITLQVNEWLVDADDLRIWAWQVLLALAGFVAVFRTVGFVSEASPAPR
nr:hypothetical protein [Arenimonas sp.]